MSATKEHAVDREAQAESKARVMEVLGPLSEPQVVPCQDVGAMGKRIVDLAADDDRRDRLGQLNRQRVLENFSIEAMVDRYARLFDEVLAGNVPGR